MPFQKGHGVFPGAERGFFKKGQTPHNKGKKYPNWKYRHTPERIEKIRRSKLALYRDKTRHPSYRDGRSFTPGYNTNRARARQLRLRGNGGDHTVGEWETLKAQYDWTCPSCRNIEPDIKLSEDHIVPLSKGGSNNIENIQPLCLRCNKSKSTKIIRYNP